MVRVAWPRGQNEDFEAVDPHRSFADVAFLVPLADEMSKKHTTQAATAQQATSDQNACEPVILTAAAFFLFFTAYVLSLLPLAEQMGKKHTTQAPTAQQATSDQNTCEPVILTAAAFLFFTTYVLLLFLLPLAEQMGKKQATQALAAKQATSDQLTDDLFLVSAALPFATQTSSFRLVQ